MDFSQLQCFHSNSEYRNANDGRRIGSGRIPVRELWDEPKYTKLGANEFAPKSGGETSPTNSSAAASTATTTTTTSTASAASTTTTSTANKTEPSKPSDNSNGEWKRIRRIAK